MRLLGAVLPALLLGSPAFSEGRIAGTVDFKGRALKPVKVKTADPACKDAIVPWERRALVRITKNAPPGPTPATPVVLESKGCMYRP